MPIIIRSVSIGIPPNYHGFLSLGTIRVLLQPVVDSNSDTVSRQAGKLMSLFKRIHRIRTTTTTAETAACRSEDDSQRCSVYGYLRRAKLFRDVGKTEPLKQLSHGQSRAGWTYNAIALCVSLVDRLLRGAKWVPLII
jgi:hypothetical protein